MSHSYNYIHRDIIILTICTMKYLFLQIAAVIACSVYLYFIFSPPASLSQNMYTLGDVLMCASIIGLLISGHKSVLLFIALFWLASNYVVRLEGPIWSAYNGFAVASVLDGVLQFIV